MSQIEINTKVTKNWIITLLAEGYNTYDIVCNYKLEEDVILECLDLDLLDKEIIIQGIDLSEEFLIQTIEKELFTKEDIKNLTMSTYSKFSNEFITNYSDYINWSKMILYISTQSDTFDVYIDIIEKNNLWDSISANDLPLDFIRQWKDKLNWTYLSMVKEFSDDEKEEFVDYIVIPASEIPEGEFIDKSQFGFVEKMSQEELEQLIEEINKHLYK